MLSFLLAAASIIDFNALPPRLTPSDPKYREGAIVTVAFVNSQEDMNEICTQLAGPLPPGGDYIGCAAPKVRFMFVANPCNYPDDRYARHVCHEMGHINGWPGDHPNPQ